MGRVCFIIMFVEYSKLLLAVCISYSHSYVSTKVYKNLLWLRIIQISTMTCNQNSYECAVAAHSLIENHFVIRNNDVKKEWFSKNNNNNK